MKDSVNDTGRAGAASIPATSNIILTVNGAVKQIAVALWTTLLDLLRERLDLYGTKKGCDHGQCGACTVLVNGKRINSCLTLAIMQEEAEIVTIEGLAKGTASSPSRVCQTRCVSMWILYAGSDLFCGWIDERRPCENSG